MKRLRLHLGRIEDELRDVQRHFPAINAVLHCRRDDFTDTVRQNMLTAYGFLDAVIDDDLDFFGDKGIEAPLQLNHLVLFSKAALSEGLLSEIENWRMIAVTTADDAWVFPSETSG